MSFVNTYANATFYISLNESKFIKKYKNKILEWNQYWKKKCIDLIWHDNRKVVFKKNKISKTKTIASISRLFEATWKKKKKLP